MITTAIWPALDYSRVPFRLYHDAEIYQREQERIFRGPTWNLLGLETEIPNAGDFRASCKGGTCARQKPGERAHPVVLAVGT